jgi:phosphatidylglycerol:prolipoprotein diacylglycerol transferase
VFEYPDIDPVAISIGPLDVHWYGLMYVLWFFAAWWGLRRRAGAPVSPVTRKQVEDLIFYVALGVFIGGRVGYMLFYNFSGFLADPLSIVFVWRGGMSFHGGLLGVLAALWLFAHRAGKPFFAISDFIAPWVPPGICFVRIGNFINGELWGRQTSPDAPWAVVVDGVARHPSQLYEAALEGLVLFLLLWWFSIRPRPRMAASGLFLVGYSVFRILLEFIRLPDDGIYFAFDWLTKGQVLSTPMLLGGLLLVALAYRRAGPAREANTAA